MDFRPILQNIIHDLTHEVSIKTIARRFHNTLIDMTVAIAERARKETGISTIGLGGGCFQNHILLTGCYEQLTQRDFQVLIHKLVPPNDGGLSLGQLAIANELF
jgi:hydrogenase maturation protein HypF